ncbi:MAG: malonic semialdehyde reductase [Micavibrio aeruginosavorus]|uniref:Putative NADH dehydrogenase/NAD(P)H nitroreductase HYS17_09480 n=1 Tax=Micavibrio aeruginosavorus TaxID=349221 RepID=A0A7T5R1D4_9BACT|nr:MAG: malonic semialdehyde reductase [Micavibrio aeruginosavorus]
MTAHKILEDDALDALFREARTFRAWQKRDVTDVLIKAVYDLAKLGPTAANCSPARFVFIQSAEAKERLKPHLDKGNVDKTMSAPLTAIIAYDTQFYDFMPQLYPQSPHARDWYAGKPAVIEETALRSGSLQGAYLMLAARALGLDCGPMSGFNKDGINCEFFADGRWKVNFLCNIGFGDATGMPARGPRLPFDQACQIL